MPKGYAAKEKSPAERQAMLEGFVHEIIVQPDKIEIRLKVDLFPPEGDGNHNKI